MPDEMTFRRVAAAVACALALWASPAAAADKPVNIVALGDSLTAGYGLANRDAFPTKLQSALAAKGIVVTISNAGVSGDTMSGTAVLTMNGTQRSFKLSAKRSEPRP